MSVIYSRNPLECELWQLELIGISYSSPLSRFPVKGNIDLDKEIFFLEKKSEMLTYHTMVITREIKRNRRLSTFLVGALIVVVTITEVILILSVMFS